MSDVSSVGSVRTADLTDWESEGHDQSAYSADCSENDQSDLEDDRRRRRRAGWRINDRSNHPKQQFGGPQPGANVILGPEANEYNFFLAFFPSFSPRPDCDTNQHLCLTENCAET